MPRKHDNRFPSPSVARLALLVTVPLAVVFGVKAIAWADVALKQWVSGDTLMATDLNANFAAISEALAKIDGIVVDEQGNVAIGTTTPTERLTVSGNAVVSGTLKVGVVIRSPTCTNVQNLAEDCSCPAGTSVVNGGAFADYGDRLRESRPISLTTWRVSCWGDTGHKPCNAVTLTCARLGAD